MFLFLLFLGGGCLLIICQNKEKVLLFLLSPPSLTINLFELSQLGILFGLRSITQLLLRNYYWMFFLFFFSLSDQREDLLERLFIFNSLLACVEMLLTRYFLTRLFFHWKSCFACKRPASDSLLVLNCASLL